MERLRQLVATHGNGFGLFEPPSRPLDLPPVATSCDRWAPLRLHPSLPSLTTGCHALSS
jgi:hypothetical protein